MKPFSLSLILMMLILTGCCPQVHLQPAHIFSPGQPIEIELKDFSFKPNHLVVLKNQSPVILLKNTDEILHNFTLLAPDRNIIFSKDLKPEESVTVSVGFLRSDNYIFYCFFHHHRGMEGMLMVD